MIIEKEITCVGQFNRTHGIEGEISASLTSSAVDFENTSTVICQIDGIYVPFFITSVRMKNNTTVLLKFEDVDDERTAKMFVNKKLFVKKEDVRQSDDVYCDYFIGYSILDGEGHLIGVIKDVDDTTENALFVVDYKDKKLYVPISEDFITAIDERQQTLTMDLPQGLVESQMG